TLEGFMCSLGVLPGQYTLSPGPDLTAHITYTEAAVTAKIVDPEDTATTSDILLATTSYQEPKASPTVAPNEISLVMFDDGGSNQFTYQQTMAAFEDCTIDIPNGVCNCVPAHFELSAGDATAGDHIFTRTFAFTASGPGMLGNALALINDCVARHTKQFPAAGELFKAQPTANLKIEAVGKEGNLTAWPIQYPISIVPSTLDVPGDACALCLLSAADPVRQCQTTPGLLLSPTNSPGFPPGDFCINTLPLFP